MASLTKLLRETQPLSSVLPPLIFGTATFNIQYNEDPYALDTKGLVEQALSHGVRAFDTSPYYGPAEELLGDALNTPFVKGHFPREKYFVLTKVGRVASDEFDYSPEWVRKSVARSLQRLHTSFLDVVYCHDVEFVSDDEVLEAVKELRRIRDEEGTVKYIGISGYPVEVLCRLAERIRDETDEPLDIVQSYANFTIQNTTLLTHGMKRLKAAGVDVVPNASVLGMGLLRQDGVPVGAAGNWHPAPEELRAAVHQAALFCERYDERLEVIAIRYALESWITAGSPVGSLGDPASGVPWTKESNQQVGGRKLGVSVMGVSHLFELTKTLMVWRSILDGMENGQEIASSAGRWKKAHEWSLNRRKAVLMIAEEIQECFGSWKDYTWDSPGKDFVNKRTLAVAWPSPEATPEPESVAKRMETRPQTIPLR
jgi:D-arabinose 1-dehydrogenase